MIAIKQRLHQSLTSFFSSSTDGLSPSTSQCVINKPLRCWNLSQLECRDDSSVVVTRLCFHCVTHWPVNTPRLCSSSSSSAADGEREDSTFRKTEPACSEATGLRVRLGFNHLLSSLLGILLQPNGPESLQQPVETSSALVPLA